MTAVLPCCPACGYDLRGLVAMWRDACPLEAVCSECGARFAWVRGMRPELYAPVWSFEHGRRASPRRWVATSLVTFWPRRLWGELLPGHVIQRGRLIWFAATWVGSATTGFHLTVGIAAMANNAPMRLPQGRAMWFTLLAWLYSGVYGHGLVFS